MIPNKTRLCNRCTTVHWVAGLTRAAPLSAATHPTAALHQAAADPAPHGWYFLPGWDTGEPAQQALTIFAGHPSWGAVLYIQDESFRPGRKLVGVAIWTSASVREPLHAAFLITIEDLIPSCGRCQTPCKVPHRLRRYRTLLPRHHSPPLLREKVVTTCRTMCYLMSQVGQRSDACQRTK